MEAQYELYHHGIKGQKWGNRRWQNKDGSLTPEGYPHYGYSGPRKGLGPKKYRVSENSTKLDEMGVKAYGNVANRLVSNNTRNRIKKGAKIGAVAGSVYGAAITGVTATMGAPIVAGGLVAYGATALATGVLSGAIRGAEYGLVVGAIETRMGRNYMRAAGQDFSKVKYSDLKEPKKK